MVSVNTLAGLAGLSCALNLWQWIAAHRFPVHQRVLDKSFAPPVTLLKPLKGCDAETEGCLLSWLQQEYPSPIQILFGVASPEDPVCKIVRKLLAAHPNISAKLIICEQQLGPNGKISTLVQLQARAVHQLLIISDADVWVPPDLLANIVVRFQDPTIGLLNCLYQLANPSTLAMHWEAIATNADFWSQVVQAKTLKPLNFALGAVMATTDAWLHRIGGFAVLLDHLADDYQLGHKIAAKGGQIELCPLVVECRSAPLDWPQAWAHQLRWARTIRVCQPAPFFLSILSNASFWPLLWLVSAPGWATAGIVAVFMLIRLATAGANLRRLTGKSLSWLESWLIPAKDLLGVAIWMFAFTGNHIEWRGQRYRILKEGRLEELRT